MRTWVKWSSLAAFGLLASSAIAADHGDPTETTAFAGSDIADLYAWMSDANELTMIMTITANELSDGAYYVFNIGRQTDAASAATAYSAEANISKLICWYDTGDQTTCVLDDGSGIEPVTSVQGLAATEIVDTEGSLRVHVGQHADPFYFYLTGFRNARTEVLQYAGALTNVDDTLYPGCPDTTITHPEANTNEYPANVTVAGALQGILTGVYDDDGMQTSAANDLAMSNVTGIVVQLNTNLLAGSGDHIQVWVATHVREAQ